MIAYLSSIFCEQKEKTARLEPFVEYKRCQEGFGLGPYFHQYSHSYTFVLGFARLRVLMSGSLVQATHTRTEQNTTGEARQTNPKAGRIYLFLILVKKARLPFAARYHSPSALRRSSEAFYSTSVP